MGLIKVPGTDVLFEGPIGGDQVGVGTGVVNSIQQTAVSRSGFDVGPYPAPAAVPPAVNLSSISQAGAPATRVAITGGSGAAILQGGNGGFIAGVGGGGGTAAPGTPAFNVKLSNCN